MPIVSIKLGVILGLVPRICYGLILLTWLDPWDKPKDDGRASPCRQQPKGRSPQRTRRNFAKPSAPSPASSIFAPLISVA
ncbi:hypothetical protein C2E26_07330 [Rhizobium sp. YIC5082]|nr:hypothetical protein C2E26_07330 [Rhizobium sp. YIC5082]